VNVRPSRVPNAPSHTTYAEPHTDATFDEVERPNNVPATRPPPQRAPQAVTERDPEPEAARLPDTGLEKLAAAIAAVMAEIKPVEKEGWNDFHRYRYAKMQDLSRELTPLMGKHGIVVFQTEDGRELFDEGKAVAVRYRFTIVHKSGQIWPERPIQTGLASCRTSKGTFDDKALNKCHTSARKYFLLSLFQIPTADEEDADGDHGNGNGQARARPQGARRPVPSTSGKLPPHFVPIVDGEQPDAWAKRFNAFIDKAESKDEIDKWYDANATVFDKLKARYETLYNSLLDYMDARTAKLAAPAGDFPGDTPLPKNDTISSGIPPLKESEQKWLNGLRDAFLQCESLEELQSTRKSDLEPAIDAVSKRALAEAEDLYEVAKDRLNG
jgi:hypothetical protein